MTDDLVNRLRRVGEGAYIGAVSEDRKAAQEAADRIESLAAALREISSVSKVYVAKSEDMAQALTALLCSHRKIALAALEGKDD
jgi:hypothetical protein